MLYDLDLGELPEGWRALNAIAVIECIDLDDDSPDIPGAKRISIRSTDDLDVWTAIGMLRGALADLEQQFLESLD